MIDEKRIKRFIEGAKKAFKEVDDPTFTFPMNILSAYELATSIEELLKAQEPRVMTLEEAKKSEFCFCESGSVFACRIFVDPADGFATIQQFGRPDLLIDSNEYGISFRFWTSRPTDEQREATPWDR